MPSAEAIEDWGGAPYMGGAGAPEAWELEVLELEVSEPLVWGPGVRAHGVWQLEAWVPGAGEYGTWGLEVEQLQDWALPACAVGGSASSLSSPCGTGDSAMYTFCARQRPPLFRQPERVGSRFSCHSI